MKVFRVLGIALLALLACSSIVSAQTFVAGTWKKVATNPPSVVGHVMLLTDGSVLALNAGCALTGNWYRLVPDSTGSYVNGAWVDAGRLPAGYNPLYFASAVLPSGNVIIMGGEYNACNSVWTTLGAMYNPKTNKWSKVPPPPGWSTIGDAQSIVLPNRSFMLANCCTADEAIMKITSGVVSWTPTGTGKADSNDEEGWTLLPDGKVLTVNAYASGGCCKKRYQIYDPATGAWTTPSNNTVVNLIDPASSELGPAVLRPDGTVFYAGGTTNNAIYDTVTGTWSAGPKFGAGLDVADGPAALLPDGNVLLDASPGFGNLGTKFFEWDGAKLHSVPGPPAAAVDSSYYGDMVVLPTGQILFTDQSTRVQIYTPKGSPCTGCAPIITSVGGTLTHGSLNNVIRGKQFNGLSQGSAYGDDSQNASNFPLVRITDSAGTVAYCRTHTFSTMAIWTGNTIVSAQFDIPSTVALGTAKLVVVTNGTPSAAKTVTIN
jgi:hypothetical protein